MDAIYRGFPIAILNYQRVLLQWKLKACGALQALGMLILVSLNSAFSRQIEGWMCRELGS